MKLLLRTKNKPHSYLSQASRNGDRPCAVLSGFAGAKIFRDVASIVTARAIWDARRTELHNPDAEDGGIEECELSDVPMCPIFADSYPVHHNNIPAPDREVEMRYRDGGRCGVVLNYLRTEITENAFRCDPDFARWRYLS